MIENKIYTLIFVFILLNLPTMRYSTDIFGDNQNLTNQVESINNFSDFSILEDSDYISSSLNASSIQMTADHGYDSISVWEKYQQLFTFGVFVSNFQLEIEIYYSYFGTMLKGIYVEAGSLHDENGNPAESNIICSAAIWDAWHTGEGVYAVRAYGNDDTRYEGGTILHQDIISVHMIRTDSKLSVTIEQDGTIKLSKSWNVNEGLSRDIDYVNVDLNINPYYTIDTTVAFTSINLILNAEADFLLDLSPLEISAITIGIIILLVGIISGAIYFSKKKKKAAAEQSIKTNSRQLLFFSDTRTDKTNNQETTKVNSNSQTYSWQIEEN